MFFFVSEWHFLNALCAHFIPLHVALILYRSHAINCVLIRVFVELHQIFIEFCRFLSKDTDLFLSFLADANEQLRTTKAIIINIFATLTINAPNQSNPLSRFVVEWYGSSLFRTTMKDILNMTRSDSIIFSILTSELRTFHVLNTQKVRKICSLRCTIAIRMISFHRVHIFMQITIFAVDFISIENCRHFEHFENEPIAETVRTFVCSYISA